MSSKNPEAIEAEVTIRNDDGSEAEDDVNEMEPVQAKTWTESEKASRRQSLLERMRSSKSKSNDSTSEEDENEDEDDIKPLEDDLQRKRKKAAEVMKRPSFQKQTSRYCKKNLVAPSISFLTQLTFFKIRYEDRLRHEDLAVQAAFEKRKESKKLSQKKRKQVFKS